MAKKDKGGAAQTAAKAEPKAETPKVPKIPRKLAEEQLAAGIMPQAVFDALESAGAFTAPGGRGEAVPGQLIEAGADSADVEAFYALRDKIDAAVKGKSAKDGRVLERVGIWVRHKGESQE